MVDPITAITTATSAFNAVKRMVGAGREIEDTLGQIGAWYGAIADLNEAERQAKNPPIFKKIVNSSSVNEEAMRVYAAKKKALQQEKELRELLMYTYGKEGYQELVDLRRSIREKREREVYAQARRRKQVFWGTLQSVAILCLAGLTLKLYQFLFTAVQTTA